MTTETKRDETLKRMVKAKDQIEAALKEGDIEQADKYIDQLDNPKQARYAKWILERIDHPHAKNRLAKIEAKYFASPPVTKPIPTPPKSTPATTTSINKKSSAPPRKRVSPLVGGLIGFLITQAILIGILLKFAVPNGTGGTPINLGDKDIITAYIIVTGLFTLLALFVTIGPGLGVMLAENSGTSPRIARFFGFSNTILLFLMPYFLSGTFEVGTILPQLICFVLPCAWYTGHITSLLGDHNIRGYIIGLLALFLWPITLLVYLVKSVIHSIKEERRVVPDEELDKSVWETLNEIARYGMTRKTSPSNLELILNIGMDKDILINILMKRGYISRTRTADVTRYYSGGKFVAREVENEKDHYYITSQGQQALQKYYRG